MQVRGCEKKVFTLPISQQHISLRISIAFETLSRVFSSLRDQNIITQNAGEVQVNVNKLKEICEC